MSMGHLSIGYRLIIDFSPSQGELFILSSKYSIHHHFEFFPVFIHCIRSIRRTFVSPPISHPELQLGTLSWLKCSPVGTKRNGGELKFIHHHFTKRVDRLRFSSIPYDRNSLPPANRPVTAIRQWIKCDNIFANEDEEVVERKMRKIQMIIMKNVTIILMTRSFVFAWEIVLRLYNEDSARSSSDKLRIARSF